LNSQHQLSEAVDHIEVEEVHETDVAQQQEHGVELSLQDRQAHVSVVQTESQDDIKEKRNREYYSVVTSTTMNDEDCFPEMKNMFANGTILKSTTFGSYLTDAKALQSDDGAQLLTVMVVILILGCFETLWKMKFGANDSDLVFSAPWQMLYYALFASLITVIRGSEHANTTCRTATRSKCFAGQCPTGYTCLQNDECCENSAVVLPPEECKDYLEHCDVVKCDHADFVGFAIANCARTCNFCFPNSTLPPGLGIPKFRCFGSADVDVGLVYGSGLQSLGMLPRSLDHREYACTDLLDDCHERMKMCRDIDFIGIMAVFCPRLCSLCTYKPSEGQCQELVPE
uniref:ShKT domain-containing protein n=1 Tax=Angiostrongylus cantonensis TaxID=6313 RepID=A0A158PBJ6_ANGCA